MYFFFIFLAIFAIIGINLILDFSFITALNLLISFAIVLLPSLPLAILIRFMPKSWFDYNKRIYHVTEFEKNFLVKLGIRKWKDKIPDLGNTVKFKKDKLDSSKNIDYLKRFITETCYAEILHIFCIIFAFLSLIFVPKQMLLTMALPVAIIYSLINVPSILIQRYNRPRLIKQLTRLERNKVVLSSQNLEQSESENNEVDSFGQQNI